MRKVFSVSLSILAVFSCSNKEKEVIAFSKSKYKTKNVFVVVMDGPRYSETWGDSTHQYIPHMANDLSKEGVTYTRFYNDGPTYTNAGHSALTTGNYQEINNSGQELPQNPSVFQYWLKQFAQQPDQAWIITSKDKLQILANTANQEWQDGYMPSTLCGNNGNGTGYCSDSLTYTRIVSTLSAKHPRLAIINFQEPDHSGHAGVWADYLKGITATDNYIYMLWNFIQNDPYYKGQTTLFVTNDHGRHLNGVADGFVNHGDNCDGCRHINCFAAGPDFKKNTIDSTRRNLVDIPATIAKIMNVTIPTGKGNVMDELFSK